MHLCTESRMRLSTVLYVYFLPEIIQTFGLPLPLKMVSVSLLYLNHENMIVTVRKLQGKKY